MNNGEKFLIKFEQYQVDYNELRQAYDKVLPTPLYQEIKRFIILRKMREVTSQLKALGESLNK